MSPVVIAELLGIAHVLEASIVEPTKVGQPHDVGTFALSTGPVDPHTERDHRDHGDQSGDVHDDENFFVLTRRHCTNLDTKNTFAQT